MPLWMVAAGISFGVVIGKEVFCGAGRNILNPAFPEGVMLAILFMNIFASLLDQLEISIRNRRRIPDV